MSEEKRQLKTWHPIKLAIAIGLFGITMQVSNKWIGWTMLIVSFYLLFAWASAVTKDRDLEL